jgi:serine/threonine-protein kinase RsbW
VPEPSRHVTLVAPASSDALQILRAVASSVAARLDFPFDTVDELRIAVNEAGTLLLEVGGSEIHLDVDPTGPHFIALMWIDADGAAWPGTGTDGSWSWQVIQGLCDEAERALHDGHPSIRLVRRSAGANGS